PGEGSRLAAPCGGRGGGSASRARARGQGPVPGPALPPGATLGRLRPPAGPRLSHTSGIGILHPSRQARGGNEARRQGQRGGGGGIHAGRAVPRTDPRVRRRRHHRRVRLRDGQSPARVFHQGRAGTDRGPLAPARRAGSAGVAGAGPVTSLDLGLIGNGTIGALLNPTGDIVWACFPRFDGDLVLRLTTDASVTALVEENFFFLEDAVTLLLGPDETVQGAVAEVGRRFLEETATYWREWVGSLGIPFEWQDAVIRAAITLELNVCEDTGAIVAAMTTSIPQAPGSRRNWDYRYCW